MSSDYEKSCFSITLKVPAKAGPAGGYAPRKVTGAGSSIDWQAIADNDLYHTVDDCSDLWSKPSKIVDFEKPYLPGKASRNLSYFYQKGTKPAAIKAMEVGHTWIGLNFSTYAELRTWLGSPNGQRLIGIAEEAFVNRLVTYSDMS